MRSQSQHQFAAIPNAQIQRSVFQRDSTLKTTMDSGFLVPILVEECLPGDTFSLKSNFFIRLASPLHVPVMDNMYLDTFYFAVPCRLVWDNFRRFMGEQDYAYDPDNPPQDYLIPQYESEEGGFDVDGLEDHMGIPVGPQVTGFTMVNALPFRAYQLIWNEWFRHQDLQSKLTIATDDGPDNPESQGYTMLLRNKRHDYFTSALPFTQKGDEVDIPIGDSVPVYGTGYNLGLSDNSGTLKGLGGNALGTGLDAAENYFGELKGTNDGGNFGFANSVGVITKLESMAHSNSAPQNTGLYADLSQASAISINQLRLAFQTQRLLERDARGGTRYTEIIRAHFRVISPDARLQRPEYLGGASTRFNFNPVQQTSATVDGQTPQGNLAAFGLTFCNKGGFHKSFTEHCYIIGLANVRCDLTYQYGLDRMWSRRTKYDIYWPAFANLGEQAIYNQEIYHTGWESLPEQDNIMGPDGDTFGYQERWAEYRYKPNKITGYMRSGLPNGESFDIWHLAQAWDAETGNPGLTSGFMQESPPIDRVLAVPGTEDNPKPQFLLDAFFQMKCARPMPVYSVPGLIDHF